LSSLFFVAGVSAIFAPVTTETAVPKATYTFTIFVSVLGGIAGGVCLTLGWLGVSKYG